MSVLKAILCLLLSYIISKLNIQFTSMVLVKIITDLYIYIYCSKKREKKKYHLILDIES